MPSAHQALLLLLPLALLLACTACQHAAPDGAAASPTLLLLDSTQAAAAIAQDDMEGFFDKISPLDMALQMGLKDTAGLTDAALRQRYRDFLRQDVVPFSPAEATALAATVTRLHNASQRAFPGLLPDTVALIKTRGHHYGDGVFYTREHCIILPQSELTDLKAPALTHIMAHELFHLLSRYRPKLREALYARIGFHPLPQPHWPLLLDTTLRQRLLLNPDGITDRYHIRVRDSAGDTLLLAPLISAAMQPAQTSARNHYMAHFRPGFYPLTASDTGYTVQSLPDGSSPLHIHDYPDFRAQITSNTDYIIHPDEILAENFALILFQCLGYQRSTALSPEGTALLKDLETLLRSRHLY